MLKIVLGYDLIGQDLRKPEVQRTPGAEKIGIRKDELMVKVSDRCAGRVPA